MKKYENCLSDSEIMKIYKDNKKQGTDLMVEKYSDYIYYVIRKHYPSFAREAADMYQNGIIGIILAMKNYNPENGAFSTYSTPFIKKEISKHVRFIASESSEYYASVHNSVERAKTKLETEGKDVTVSSLMDETGLSNKIVKRELKVDRTKVSYDLLTDIGTNLGLTDDFVIDDILSGIPDMNKNVIKMKVIEEIPFTTIAKQLNASIFTIRKAYDDGIHELRKKLA